MKPTIFRSLAQRLRLLAIAILCAASAGAQAASTDIATSPLVTSSTTAVLPNLVFVLDDSGSMDWDYLPDWANDNYCKGTSGSFNRPCCRDGSDSGSSSSCWTSAAPFTRRGHPPYMNSDFNMVYYNPEITYTPPLNADGSSKNSMTSANTSGWTSVKIDAYNVQNTNSINLLTQFPDTEWCTSGAYTNCLRNDNYILPGTVGGNTYATYRSTTASGTGQAANGTFAAPTVSATRSWGPHYYAIIPGEYCTAPNLRTCTASSAPVANYIYPAKVRWCNSSALTTCQAIKTPTYQYIRYPGVAIGGTSGTSATATITIGGSGNTSITQVTVNGINLLSSPTSGSTNSSTVASRLRDEINATSGAGTCNTSTTVFCATRSGSMVTIYAPVSMGAITFTPVVTKSGSKSATPTAFSGGVDPVAATFVPGSFQRIDIVPSVNSYPYPGAAAKAATRTDCAAATCTYNEEMTNFANWWTYYHSRMQMMKSSASIAFSPIDNRYRVGIFTINTSSTSTGSNFLDIGTFDSTQKSAWYTKLFAANPSGSTPLRAALSKAGRIFAGRLGTDPVQYSCQQNFTILSTDGYWNSSSGYREDGSTAIGNQDGSAARPMLDGNNTSDTLADVAYYYYMTDLRPAGSIGALGDDVSQNIVPVNGKDTASHQHMTTFTLGLGISGYMDFSPTYEIDGSGDYFDVRNGTAAGPGVCTWQSSGACNWPAPADSSQANIDDLWHAAVNGRGTYFAATNPTTLATGLSAALAGVSARTGASAAATTSNPNVTSGDNFVFSSTFTTVDWAGELVRQQLDLNTGQILPAIDWAAQALLDGRVSSASDTRAIYTYDPAGANKLKAFLWGNLTAAEQAYFGSANVATLSQGLSGANLTNASGQNLVNFIRGQRGNEGQPGDPSKYYRTRAHVLGDIVSAEAVYVKAPMYNYTDSGYDTFKTNNAARQGMVYVAANDGMLHAFNADTGQEEWAYVPSLVMSNLYKLADSGYATRHQFFVDGTPTVGDVYIGGAWKTILVGGLNAGGRGFYALDITNPSSPKGLWEFTHDTSAGTGYVTDANLGYSFGNPVITKLKNGAWTVMVTSGYNNVSPGDGKGYLFVLNAANGAKITPPATPITTNTGSTGTISGLCATAPCPSGLSRIAAWTEDGMTDNTATRVYGGDLFGNLWRFDVNGDVGASGYDAQQIAYFRSSGGAIQPITAKPELGDVNGTSVVFVGTGRMLGATDMSDTSQQTFYAVKDSLGASSIGNARSQAGMIKQTLTDFTDSNGAAARKTTAYAVNFASDVGWYIDLPDSGERSYTDPALALGTLVFTANVPNSSACTVGGYSWIYYLDYRSGSSVSSSAEEVAGRRLGNALATRPVVVKLPNNSIVSLTRLSDSTTVTTNIPVGSSNTATRRVSWRELVNDE